MNYSDTASYKGQWKDDKRHGHGTFIASDKSEYTGSWDGDFKHGVGKMTEHDPNDDTPGAVQVYDGSWVDGRKCGQGHIVYSNKEEYIGSWSDNAPNGEGVYTAGDHTYTGTFVNGKYHGNGKTEYKNHDLYVGSYVNGYKEGEGVYTNSDGSIKHSGLWRFDEPSITITLADGSHYVGNVNSAGLPENRGTITYNDGSVYDGDFKAGLRDGRGILKDSFGIAHAGDWIKDQEVFYQGDRNKLGERHGKGSVSTKSGKEQNSLSGKFSFKRDVVISGDADRVSNNQDQTANHLGKSDRGNVNAEQQIEQDESTKN